MKLIDKTLHVQYWKFLLSIGLAFVVLSCSDSSPNSTESLYSPQRVAVIGPSIAEIMDELNLLEHVVALGEFGPWPEAIKDRPVVGGYNDPNAEQIVALNIDTVLNVKSQAAVNAHQRLQALGIKVVALDTSTFDGVFQSIKEIGTLFNKQSAAIQLINRLQNEISKIEQQAKDLEKRSVLFVVDANPVYVAGPGSHIDQLISMTGGENIAYDAVSPYQQLSLEAILERKPEIIIDTSDNNHEPLRGRSPGAWQQWQFLPAVRNNQVYWIDPSRLVIPGIRIPEMAKLMGKLIHPEVFGEPEANEYQKYGE